MCAKHAEGTDALATHALAAYTPCQRPHLCVLHFAAVRHLLPVMLQGDHIPISVA
jgi:hypothetical protein